MCAVLSCIVYSRPIQAKIESYDVWAKAFIPNTHPTNPGYIRPVPGANNKFMIPGPGIPGTVQPLPLVGNCYNTNNRGFSKDVTAEAKLTVRVRFSIDGQVLSAVSTDKIPSAITEQYDCPTGAVTCSKAPDLGGIIVDQPTIVAGIVSIRLRGSGTNPCLPVPAALTPAIKFDVMVQIDPSTGFVKSDGTVARFPSYEAYVRLNDEPPVVIFQEPPSPGSTAWSLFFDRAVGNQIVFANFDGDWTSIDLGHRFSFRINKNKIKLTERNANGLSISRDTNFDALLGKGYHVTRDNDPEVLNFLGFSPDIQASILAAGPLPSYFDVKRDGGNLTSAWNGLLVIKDEKAKFKEMRQPGQSTSKPYSFSKTGSF